MGYSQQDRQEKHAKIRNTEKYGNKTLYTILDITYNFIE